MIEASTITISRAHFPSVTVDGGGASSGSLLYTAVQYLEAGKCDFAVVGATNLIFKPGVQIGETNKLLLK